MRRRKRFGRRLAAGLLMGALVLPLPAAAVSFQDVPGDHWAAAAIYAMADRGVIQGVRADSFRPEREVTLAEFVAMLSRAYFRTPAARAGEPWYAPSLAAAETMGLLEDCGEKDPNAVLTRYDMARILYALTTYFGASHAWNTAPSLIADWNTVPPDCRDAVLTCYDLGLLNGVNVAGAFHGEGTMTRAQAAAVLDRLLGGVLSPDEGGLSGVETVRGEVTALAAALCEELGNGGSRSGSPPSARRTGQFRYELTMVDQIRKGYGSMEAMGGQLRQMKADPDAVGLVSCCGFALYCWESCLSGPSFYGTVTEIAVKRHFQPFLEGDGTVDYIRDHARPGDLLLYTNAAEDVGQAPPVASGIGGARYTHVEVFLGSYEGTDANGETYAFPFACAGSNESGRNRDACVKSLESTVAPLTPGHRAVYLLSLKSWMNAGYRPAAPGTEADPILLAIQRTVPAGAETGG